MTKDLGGEAGRSDGHDRVVSLGDSRPPSGPHSVLDGVWRYWSSLKRERLVPLRSEIDPRGIEGALDCAFILERIAPGIARFRLAGSHLVEMMGSEVRGMPLSVLFTPESRRPLADAIEGVFAGPETLRLTLSGGRGLARPPFSAQMIVLPLKSDLGDTNRALGCLSVTGSFGRPPRRLTIRDVERTDLVGGGAVAAELPSGAPELEIVDEGPTLRPVPGVPHLRVVEPID